MRLLLATTAALLSFAAQLFSQDFPKPVGHVNDFAGVLSVSEEQALESRLRVYQVSTSNEIAVVVVRSLGGYAVDDYAQRLGEEWGVGTEEKDNGVLFLVAVADREMSIEVGYGLEPLVTDTDAKRIIERAIIPRFREGDYPGGIAAGVEGIIQRIDESSASEGGAVASSREEGRSGRALLVVFLILVALVGLAGVVKLLVMFRRGGGGTVAPDTFLPPPLPPITYYPPRSTPDPKSSSSDEEESSRRRRRSRDNDNDSGSSSSGGFGGGSSSGGFGGFGGGSFGGGGASGKW